MADILVTESGMNALANRANAISGNCTVAYTDVSQVLSNIDWKLAVEANIAAELQKIKKAIKSQEEKMDDYKNTIIQTSERMTAKDKALAGDMSAISVKVSIIGATDVVVKGIHSVAKSGKKKGKHSWWDTVKKVGKHTIKELWPFAYKMTGLIVDELGEVAEFAGKASKKFATVGLAMNFLENGWEALQGKKSLKRALKETCAEWAVDEVATDIITLTVAGVCCAIGQPELVPFARMIASGIWTGINMVYDEITDDDLTEKISDGLLSKTSAKKVAKSGGGGRAF